MGKIQNLGIIGCFTALTACGTAHNNAPENPPAPSGPLPELTEAEAGNINITMDFLSCALVSTDGIADPYLYEAILEFCAEDTGFDHDVFGDVIDQYTKRYGENWPKMVSALFEKQHMALSM